MSRRGENIYKRKDGRWEGRYAKGYVGGKIKYGYVYGKTYKATKEKLSKYTGFNNSQKPINLKDRFSFIEISSKWLETAKPQLKQSSIVKYTNILENYLHPKFYETSINCITCNDLINFSTELLTTGGPKGAGLSPKTVSSIISVLKSIFAYASRYEGIIMPDFNCINIKQNPKPMRILSIEEQHRLT